MRMNKEMLVSGSRTDDSDEDLVAELQRDDGDALTTLFDRYADDVHTYCFRRTASWPTAEDATATVFLEVWRGRAKVVVTNGSALPWLYGIANNVCRNATRSSNRWLRALSRAPALQPEYDPADAVAGRIDSERHMSHVLAAVQQLPRAEQDVLALIVWSGLSYANAATALGVPIGTIRSRLARARRRLALDVAETPSATSPSEDDHA
jgi:RNA polymerase sigma-70 factor (ECF subfamily)